MDEDNEFRGSFLKPPAPRPVKIVAIKPDMTAQEALALMIITLYGQSGILDYDLKFTEGDIRHFAAMAERHLAGA
jgi:hypothetical protein